MIIDLMPSTLCFGNRLVRESVNRDMKDGLIKRRPYFVITAAMAATAAVLVLSACSPTTNVTASGSTARTVSVSSTGNADVVPDAAKASITIEVTDPTSAQKAQEDAAVASTKVLDALKTAGIDQKDIATQAISVGPNYNYTQDGGQQLIGYRASQSITVTFRDLANAGATLDAAVVAGGNAVRVDSLTPFVTDPTVAANKAREQAVSIATAQAEQYAKLLGFTLGPVASVSEQTSSTAPPPIAYADAAAAPATKISTPIEPGTQQVSVTVSIAWEIK
jgi:uncharacterized protein YggE